jgi:ABC-type Zn uptake system ZnuABC Zn-binding protein ZnuA
MREGAVRLIIAEPWSNSAVVAQVAARSGARAVILAASVGADPEARDYLALFDLNVRRIVEAAAAPR